MTAMAGSRKLWQVRGRNSTPRSEIAVQGVK